MPELRPQEGMVQRIVATERECLVVIELAPGTLIESHKHEVDEIGAVVKGQVVMAIAGEQRVLTAGDCYRIPSGTAHGARVLQDPVTIVDCFAPARDDLRKAFERQNAAKPARLP